MSSTSPTSWPPQVFLRPDAVRRRLALVRGHARRGQRLLLVEVLAFEAVVPLLFRLPLPWVERLLVGRGHARRRVRDPTAVAAVVDAGIEIGWPIVRPGCLTRSSCLYWLLHSQEGDVRLVFGMGQPDGEVAGHAWLTHEGRPYLEKQDPRPTFEPVWVLGR